MLISKGGEHMAYLDFEREIERLTEIADQGGDDSGTRTQRLEDLQDFVNAVEELTGEQQQTNGPAL